MVRIQKFRSQKYIYIFQGTVVDVDFKMDKDTHRMRGQYDDVMVMSL